MRQREQTLHDTILEFLKTQGPGYEFTSCSLRVAIPEITARSFGTNLRLMADEWGYTMDTGKRHKGARSKRPAIVWRTTGSIINAQITGRSGITGRKGHGAGGGAQTPPPSRIHPSDLQKIEVRDLTDTIFEALVRLEELAQPSRTDLSRVPLGRLKDELKNRKKEAKRGNWFRNKSL